VLEGGSTNSAITSPAAALALTLMYLKTNDASIAARLRVPGTAHGLDGLRPHLVLLRVLGRALVMWDGVAPTAEWVAEQLPPLLQAPLHRALERLQLTAAGGGGTAGGGTAGGGAPPVGADAVAAAAAGPTVTAGAGADPLAIAQAQVHAAAGACLAIGLRFAGSGSARAEALLRHHALQLLAAKRGAAALGEAGAPQNRGRLDKQLLEGCLDCVVLALGLVMAGSGHLPTLRLLQHLRCV
jgi:anaphase-promoting complex subunit 1